MTKYEEILESMRNDIDWDDLPQDSRSALYKAEKTWKIEAKKEYFEMQTNLSEGKRQVKEQQSTISSLESRLRALESKTKEAEGL